MSRARFAALVCCLSACTDAEDTTYDAFDAEVEAYLEEYDLDGATAIIVHRDRGVLHHRGYGSFERDRISLLASASKTLTAGVLMSLHDQGVLDVDEPLQAADMGWPERPINFSVAQALSNSSGLVTLIQDPTYPDYLCQYLPLGTVAECGEKIYASDDAEDVVPPDTVFGYGGAQWQVAGAVAEKASGKTWSQLVDEIYVQPCGLDVLAYTNHYGQAFVAGGGLEQAFGYPDFFDGDLEDLNPTDNPNMEGGAYATVEDYGKLLLMQLRGGQCDNGRVLSAASVDRMQEDRVADAYGGSSGLDSGLEGYGMGWWIDRDHPGIFSDGGAYGAIPWIDVNRGYGVMVILEADTAVGNALRLRLQPLVDGFLVEETS